MDRDSNPLWADDADVLAAIGRHLSDQPTKVAVRLPKELARKALASWQRDDTEQAVSSESADEQATRLKAATLALIGLSIESESSSDADAVIVELDAWYIGAALQAADDAGLLGHSGPRI
jgi:hypothetical protein